MTNRGVSIPESEDVWKSKLPLKIKIFMWQLKNNKLEVATLLKKRGWKGGVHCCLCGKVETTNHVFLVLDLEVCMVLPQRCFRLDRVSY
jgi:hypothetical protein